MTGEEKLCAVCGRDVNERPGGVVHVFPNEEGGYRREHYCVDHNPKPPTAEQRAARERAELEAAVAGLRFEEVLIGSLQDLHRPVTPADRANIGTELIRFLDRFVGHENRLRALEGKPPIPDEWSRRSEDSD